MFGHILVPLDGSTLAESVLPAAAEIARVFGARVTLVHVIERNPPRRIHGETHLDDPDVASTYLDRVAERAFAAGTAVETHVHVEPVERVGASIVQHIEELAGDLTVMCTHGASGVREFLFGSIAQQILSKLAGPVLISRPRAGEPAAGFRCRRVLVPLDGDPAHETSLEAASGLGRAFAADVHILRVVPTFGTLEGPRALQSRLLPGTTVQLLELDAEHATSYLADHRRRLSKRGLKVTAEIDRGEPAERIVATARRRGVDVIVLSTHGRKSMDAFWEGSIGSRLSRSSAVPLLMVPAPPRSDGSRSTDRG